MVSRSSHFGHRARGFRRYALWMQEDERTLQQSNAQDARDLLLGMTRSYLAELGTSHDLELRSRIIVPAGSMNIDASAVAVPVTARAITT